MSKASSDRCASRMDSLSLFSHCLVKVCLNWRSTAVTFMLLLLLRLLGFTYSAADRVRLPVLLASTFRHKPSAVARSNNNCNMAKPMSFLLARAADMLAILAATAERQVLMRWISSSSDSSLCRSASQRGSRSMSARVTFIWKRRGTQRYLTDSSR